MLLISRWKFVSFFRHSDICVFYDEKWLIEKADVKLKSYKVTVNGQKTTAMHIMPIIPRNKRNQSIKFDQFIELLWETKNVFHQF